MGLAQSSFLTFLPGYLNWAYTLFSLLFVWASVITTAVRFVCPGSFLSPASAYWPFSSCHLAAIKSTDWNLLLRTQFRQMINLDLIQLGFMRLSLFQEVPTGTLDFFDPCLVLSEIGVVHAIGKEDTIEVIDFMENAATE